MTGRPFRSSNRHVTRPSPSSLLSAALDSAKGRIVRTTSDAELAGRAHELGIDIPADAPRGVQAASQEGRMESGHTAFEGHTERPDPIREDVHSSAEERSAVRPGRSSSSHTRVVDVRNIVTVDDHDVGSRHRSRGRPGSPWVTPQGLNPLSNTRVSRERRDTSWM